MERHVTLSSLLPMLLAFLLLLSLPSLSLQLDFTQPHYPPHVYVFENAPIGFNLTTIEDERPNSSGKIVSITYQGSSQAFYVFKIPNEPKWNVILNRKLDYETQRSMYVAFLAEGSSQNVESTDISFKLHVQDVNDNAPQFQNLPYNAEVDEDAKRGTSVSISIHATDVDEGPGGTVRYQLEPVSQGSSNGQESTFIMNSETGRVTLNGPLDYESKTFYHYRVIAKDQGNPSFNSSTDLFITVKDVQDSPPIFVNIPYVAPVDENSALDSSVLTVRAVDQDRAIPNNVTYNITHSTCPGLFQLDAHTGVIFVSGGLDRDIPPLRDQNGLCFINLQATEVNSGTPQKGNFTATATATINVVDLNDNAPFFPHTDFSANITENAPPGTPLQLDAGQQIIVTDLDQGLNSAIQLSLVTEDETFELTTSSIQSNGSVQLRVKNSAKLDYEHVQTLIVKIQASDRGSQHTPVTATVTVTLVNLNEYSPQFSQVSYTATVAEGSRRNAFVIAINATDRDAGEYGTVTYTLNNARKLFVIDSHTGEVTVASSQTDRERENRYYLMVVATDGGGLQQTVPLTVNISDVNDNPPVFLRHQYDVILNENSTVFSRKVAVQATDADEEGTENTNVTYYISDTRPTGLESHFRLDPFSGQLSVTRALDYDVLQFPASSKGIVELKGLATDNGKPTRMSATATVVITLTDLNDNSPVLHDTPYSTEIVEGSREGTFVFNVTATDRDGSAPNNLITYSIESGGQDRFRIDPNTGTLSVSGHLDREQVPLYNLLIVAKDRAAVPKSSSSQLIIRIVDVNDEMPSFGDKEDARIKVNETVGGKLFDMSATDPDLNSALRYEIQYRESSAQPPGVNIQEWVRIDASTGEVMAKKPLDRLQVQTLVLRAEVTDRNGTLHTPQTKIATLTITVMDINNHSPQFSPSGTVPATIRENMGNGTALTFGTPLQVFDKDEGDNSLFHVTVTGMNMRYFEVLPSTVRSSADLLVRVKDNSILDYESHTNLNIKLLARELQTNSRRSGSVTIDVKLEDENDHSPHFDNDTYQATIPEAQPVGTTVIVMKATDLDRSPQFNTITYSMQGAENLFAINSSTGVVTLLTNATDYDTLPNTYQLTVLASDNEGRRGNALLVITLTDINDLTPRFDRSVFSATLKEEHNEFESPLVVTAVDGDQPGTPASNVTYSILRSHPENLWSSFRLQDRYSGLIQVASPLNLEILPSNLVTLTLRATDGGGRSSTASVEIHVVDVNDHTPMFSPGPSSGSVPVLENASIGTHVYTFNATDADKTYPNNNVTYLISSGANDQFSLDELGHLTVSHALDREEVASYSLVVLALDRGVPQKTGTTTLSVVVSDVNDVPPEFVHSSVTKDVLENTKGVVYIMTATDKDVNPHLVYEIVWANSTRSGSLLSSDFQTLFQMDSSTGAIRIHGELDRETLDNAVLAVKVQDTKSQTGIQTATGSVTINVKDEDDNPPQFSVSSLTVSVDENAARGVPFTMPQISVNDTDQGENAQFVLKVPESLRSTIEVVPSTARGSTVVIFRVGSNNSLLNYETTPSINFQVWAEGTKNRNQSTYCNVTLLINNLNDNLPQFQRSEYIANISESTSMGTSVTTVEATDNDRGSLGDVTYSILGENALFSVDNASGVIVTSETAKHYNYEKTHEYYLTVMATDGGGATTTTRVHVILDDINDEKPTFERPEYSAFLKENAPSFDKGTTVKATDNDKPGTPNSEVFYSLQGHSNFTINASSGQLGLRSPVNYEAVSGGVITLTVFATDRGSPPLSSSVQISVIIQDENDVEPVFEKSAYFGNVTEGSQSNTNVLKVHAYDLDGSAPNNEVFYLLASGGRDKFKVDSYTGQVSTIGDIDREVKASYTLVVQAVDKGSPPKTASTTVTVHVNNVNDDLPRFVPEKVSVTVTEEQAPGTVVYSFGAIDNDEDALLRYHIVWNQSFGYDEDLSNVSQSVLKQAFSVDDSSGVITINQRLDRESLETATLIVLVRDTHAPPHSATVQTATGTVNIQVKDADDHPPSFSSSDYVASLVENSPEGIPIHLAVPVSVSDPDQGINGEFRLSVSTDCLRISPSTARIQATVFISVQDPTCFDYERHHHLDFKIFASGDGESNFATNTSVRLNINNTNDERPHFTQSEYFTKVQENLNVSTSVFTVQATDKDSPPYNTIEYSLQGGDGVFAINNVTGEVVVSKKQLNYETRENYELRVEASDIGGLRDSVPLTVNLIDLNDNKPKFVRPQYQAFVVENDRQFRKGVTVEAKDADGTEQNRGVHYSLSPTPQWSSHFKVNASTGLLQLTTPLDYEALGVELEGVITLVVLATDQGTPPLTGSVNVTVTVQDINDMPPVFSELHYMGNVTENQGPGVVVAQVNATDGDKSSPNNEVFYVIASGGNDKFLVNSTSGVISTVTSLDREHVADYNLTVLAIDRGSPAFTVSTTVSVIVDNINDDPPKFVSPQIAVSFMETHGYGSTVATCTATDGDADSNLKFSILWNLSSGLDDQQQNVSSDVLKNNFNLMHDRVVTNLYHGLDREAVESAILYVQVIDRNAAPETKQTATCTVTVQVEDRDDNPPLFSGQHFSANLTENSPRGTPLQFSVPITVTDIDKDENAAFTLSLSNYTNCLDVLPARARSETTVLIRVKDSTCFDYEKQTVATFEVVAEGLGNGNFTTNTRVHLNILNINDNTPHFTSSSYKVSVPENRNVSYSIITVQAVDADSPPYNTFFYSLQGGDGIFAINNVTGEVVVSKRKLDYETRENYELRVEASDIGGLRDSVSLTVSLTDLNDNKPKFVRPQYQAFVVENDRQFRKGVAVEAKDADGTEQNRGVRYSLSPTPQWSSHFKVNASTGLLQLTTPLDYEALGVELEGVITLVVLATDQGTPPLTGSVNVTVTVQDVNDVVPVFSELHYMGNVTENQGEGVVVAQVNAMDGDKSTPNNEVFYVMASGGNDQFQVNSTSGVISTVTSLDREHSSDYNLTVLAIDRGSPAFTVSTTVSVIVDNINDDPPKFVSSQLTVSFLETTERGSKVVTCSAKDGDADANLTFSILWNLSSGLGDQQQPVSLEVLKDNFDLSGDVVVTNLQHGLDREAVEQAILYIQVIDNNAAPGTNQTATSTVTVQVEDKDDNPPLFSGQHFSANLTENSPRGTPLQFSVPITVTDIDKDENAAFTLSLFNYTNCLDVLPARARSETTVLIRVKDSTCFDYEKQTIATFEVVAEGLGNGNFTTNTRVHLNILNINDNTPHFTSSSYKVSVPENRNVSYSIITVQAMDADSPPYNTFFYSLQGGDGIFAINNVTGEVVVSKRKLDYETRENYELRVEASDIGGLRDSVSLTVSLTDLNDNKPKFVRPQYQAFVVENEAHFNRELNITATDLDEGSNQEIRYSVSPLSQLADNFTINPVTGWLSLSQPQGLDYEALPDMDSGEVHLIVEACDQGTPSLCSNASVLVTVRDENDNTPVFQQSYHGNISENAPLDAFLLNVTATDSDGREPNNKVFYVMSGIGSDKFKVDSSSGRISRAGQLDSDTENFYNLTITAIDGGSPAKSSSTFVTVQVLDVNDVPPEFKPRSESVDVNESNELSPGRPGRLVAKLWAQDPDQDSELFYQVEWSRCRGFGPNQESLNVSVLQNAFEVDSRSGEIRVRGTNLDRETLSRAVLAVNVTDLKANGAPQNSTGTLTINVVDVNDHKPQFNQVSYTAQIAENAVKDSVLHIVSTDQMNVTDLDTDQNCVFSIRVEGAESYYFTAEPITARSFALVQLRVRNGSVLDYEKRHNITFNVTVRETSTPDHFTNTVTVTVIITDVNDNSPTFRRNFSASVQENSPPKTNITRIEAFDEDSGNFGKITYSLAGDAARFSIDPSTGDVMTADGSLDRESRDTYLITVVATDGGGRRSGAPLTITITDDNDIVPHFQANYSTRVLENSVDLSPPVILLAEDEDLANTPNSNLTYYLESCTPVPCLDFTLDEVSGQLTLTKELDYEHTRTVELVVTANDQGSMRLTGTATVTIHVDDVNDVDPAFSQQLYTARIDENSEEGTYVGNVSAHDGDGTSPNNVVFYVLDSGRGSDKFRVNSSTGVVTVGPGALLDRESDDSYDLMMLVLDRGDPPRSSSATLSVALLDVNDEVPVFGEVGRVVRVPEDLEVGRVVEVVNATDPDEDSALEYSWVLEESRASTDRGVPVNISWISAWFNVNSSTGAVTVSSELDRELAEIIVMKIRVNDTRGVYKLPQTALATLTITLTDVNDNHPVISGSLSLHVSEALAVGTEVASYTATDADRDQTVTFSVLHEDQGYFDISPAGKLSLQRQIDRETTPTVNFTVIATDSGLPPLASNVTIMVTVLDANDNDPQFQNTSYVFSIAEDAPENTLVVTINATDRDQGANANVTFDFADNVYEFVLNKSTGEIRVHKHLDRETRSSYSFGVAALDNPVTDVKRRTIQQVTIGITDVNDNAPKFTNLGPGDYDYTAQIDETKGLGAKVLSIQPGPVQASDRDEGSNGELSFHLIPKDTVDYFRMDPKTGEVFVNGSIQGEAGVYRYVVTVVDHGQPPLNVSANITIEVLDQNLNDPRFESDYAHIPPIPECSKIGTSIITFVAQDDDRNKETNGKVLYYFDNTTTANPVDLSYFSLNPHTGLLTSARTFNREKQDAFQIGVIAQDKGVPNVRYSKPLRITIHIDDGNDNGPEFNVTHYSFTVPEGQEGVVVGQVYAQDLDEYKSTCYTLDGDHKDFFNITSHTDRPADLLLVKTLDREDADQASFSLTVSATDCTPSTSVCDMHNFDPVFATVYITVSDVNDNPPNFTRSVLTFGVTSTADAGHLIANLQEHVNDPDLGANRVHAFYPVGSYRMDPKLNASMGISRRSSSSRAQGLQPQPLSLSINGSLTTRSALPGDAEGFFTWTILANDSAGHDTVVLKIYVVGKDKLIKISFFTSVEELRHMQDDILRDLSEKTGLQFVTDGREPFEDSSGIDSSKSVLVAHAVDENENAMDANALMNFLDHQVVATDYLKSRYRLYNIQTYKAAESSAGDDLKKMEYILGAIICVLVIAFLITLYLMLNNIRRFKRKLKAATIETYPMTKQQGVPGLKTPQTNPIFGKDEDLAAQEQMDQDRESHHSDNSLDNNSVDLETMKTDSWGLDEQEVTLDLYGEDSEQACTAGKDHTFYLDQALAEHERHKNSHPHRLSRNPSGLTNNGLSNGRVPNGEAQTMEFDLEECESTDI